MDMLIRIHKNRKSLWPAAVMLLCSWMLAGCVFESDLEPTSGVNLSVRFNWAQVESPASPASMALSVFADGAQPVQVAFAGRDGGVVSLLPNTYKLIGFNDDTESLFSRGDNWEWFEIYAQRTELSRISRMFHGTRSVPVARGTESEEIVFEPDELWTAALGDTRITTDTMQTVVMPMQSAITEYHFTINNVQNLSYAVGITGTLSGMSSSWFPAQQKGSDTHCIIPFELSGEGSTLEGTIRTFGHCPGEDADNHAEHMLTIYAEMKDGSKVYFVSDVTEAMHDPNHINEDDGGTGNTDIPIVIDELPLPKPITNGSGLQPAVGEWTEINIPIPMN